MFGFSKGPKIWFGFQNKALFIKFTNSKRLNLILKKTGKSPKKERSKAMEEPQNGNGGLEVAEEENEPSGPLPAPPARRKRPLQFEQAYLDALPSANMSVHFLLQLHF